MEDELTKIVVFKENLHEKTREDKRSAIVDSMTKIREKCLEYYPIEEW
jgi:hypothetical protein